MSAKTNNSGTVETTVDVELTAKALAKAMHDGDVVNFRHIFSSLSPAREKSPEQFETERYEYFLPDAEMSSNTEFGECFDMVKAPEIWQHIETELNEERPPQLPSELLMKLADNAVRLGKYSSAAQAYELLRIRLRIQEEFLTQSDKALDENDIKRAVKGYWAAAGLSYDYAAFPEPLPSVPDYQTRSLMLHGEYPDNPEDGVAMEIPEKHVNSALAYLLVESEIAMRLEERSLDVRIEFLRDLVHRLDPEWNVFVERYRNAIEMYSGISERMAEAAEAGSESLADEIMEQAELDPEEVTAQLLGRRIENGEWWQYLKEIAFEHPAGVLFVARQIVGEHEYLVPRYREDSRIAQVLGLTEQLQGK